MRITVIALGAALTVTSAAVAQERIVLTLDQALEIARRQNPEYRQALNQERAAGAQVNAGLGAFLPTLSARTSFAGASSRTVTGENDFGQAVSLPSAIDFERSSASQAVGASLTLFDGLSNLNTLRSARESEERFSAGSEAALIRTEAETKRRFYDALRTGQLVELEERLLTQAREQLAATERLFRAAGATQEDVLGAQADVAGQELALARAAGEAEKAKLLLKEYLGITEAIEFDVKGELRGVLDPSELDDQALLARALANHPSVVALDAAANAAASSATAARGARWPTIGVNASFGRSMSLSSYDALFKLNPQNRSFSFGVDLTWPLFTGFATSAQIANADLQARNAEEQLVAGRLSVERAVKSALIDVRNAHRALELARQSAALSVERLRLARERYAVAAITFPNLQLLTTQAASAERQLLQAEFDLARAAATLEEAVGGPIGR
ncbi:MAG: TolC family protein [Gemmatimonadales bacterium]